MNNERNTVGKQCFKLLICGFLCLALLVTAGLPACSPGSSERTQLLVICAGSLMGPFQEIEKAYEAVNPDIDVLIEGHGSIQVIRQVTELGVLADVVAVADHSLIPPMMYTATAPETGKPYADWYIRFASNTLGIAYTSQSRYADEITADNWYEIVSKPDVKLGFPDPRFDACGYRALMACKLAELYYGDETIFERVLGEFEYPLKIQEDKGTGTILIPEIVKPYTVSIRGSSVVLLGILESGDIDYAFEYRSVARQRNLRFLELPPEINLGSDDFQKLGYNLNVKLDYQRFASVIPEFICQRIIYGVTIPNNSPHHTEAVRFMNFLLGVEGSGIFTGQYQSFLALEADNYELVPDELKQALLSEK